MSLAVLANHMASKGRNGDSMLVHMAPEEVRGLHALAAAHGGELTINPETGLPEANFLKRLLPTIIGAAITAATGLPAWQVALGVGGVEAARTGDLGKGISAGLGAYGGASIGAGLSTAGEAALAGGAEAAAAGQAAASAITPEMIAASNAALADAGMGASVTEASLREAATREAVRNYAAEAGAFDKVSAGLRGLTEKGGRDAFMSAMGGGKDLFKAGYMAAAPLVAADAARAKMPQTLTKPPMFQRRSFDPYSGTYDLIGGPVYGASGGLMGMASGGVAFESGTTPSYQRASMSPGMLDFAQKSEPVVRMASGGLPALALPSDVANYTPQQKAQMYNQFLTQGYSDAAIRAAAGQQSDTDWQALQGLAAQQRVQLPQNVASLDPTAKANLYNQYLSQGISDAQIRAAVGPQSDTDWQSLQQLAAQQNAPGVSGAERAVLTTKDWQSVTGQQGIAGLNANIRNWINSNPNATYDQIKSAASEYGVDAQDITRALQATGGSKALQAVTTTDNWKSREGSTGIKGLNDNINKWLRENPNATEATIRSEMSKWGLSDEDVFRATGKKVSEVAYKPTVDAVNVTGTDTISVVDTTPTAGTTFGGTVISGTSGDTITGGGTTVIPPYVAPEPKVTLGDPFQPKAPTMSEVRTAYEQGGGSTRMPTITDIKPGERTYTYNEAFGLLQSYLQNNPNAQYADVLAFASARGIPAMQARAAYNEFRFSGMTGGSKQAYDYLMGRGAYPLKPFSPTGEIMRPYAESVLGMPENRKVKKVIFDPETRTYKPNPEYVERKSAVDTAPIRDVGGNVPTMSSVTEAYFRANPDVRAAWQSGTTGMSADEYALFHWNTHGRGEGRGGWTGTSAGGTSGGGTSGGGTSGGRLTDTDTIVPAARGGLMDIAAAAASGGQFNLGSYSDGGRLLRGPGDGVSDSIPATIGGKRPARLADGEFVVPARIVSEIGNGSTEAGARKLYAMMDRVQRARAKTTGKGRVAKDTKADKYLPA